MKIKRFLGFRRIKGTNFVDGWSWHCDIFNKIVHRCYNDFSIRYFSNDKMIRFMTPWCTSYEFNLRRREK